MSEFGKLNLDEMAQEDQRVNSDQQASFLDKFVPMPKPKPGQTGVVAVRILPPLKGKRLYNYTRIHNINGRKVHCPKRLVQGKWDKTPNPIVDFYNSLWRDADKFEQAGRRDEAERCKSEARSIKPIERYYYNAIVRKLTDAEGNTHSNVGPRILSVGKTLHKMIVRAIVGDEVEEALGDITDPQTGYDFHIKVEMRGTGNESYPNYDRSSFARDPSPLGTPEEVQKWVSEMHDLDELHRIVPLDELNKELAIHRGLIEDEKEGFNVNDFDAKYGRVASDEEAVDSVVSSKATTNTTSVAATTESEVEEVEVGDEDFLRQMQEMEKDN
jgi:hypothetical protein